MSDGEVTKLPVVRAGIGMDPAEVVRQSTYPLDFHAGERAFVDPAFEYGGLIVTSSVDFEVLGAHRLFIEDVRYWMIGVDFDEVELISASPSFLTVDEALARAQEWVGEIESAGWQRQRFLYSMPEREPYTDWNTLREAFLLPGGKKILGATIGVWHSADNEQMLIVGVQHKAPGGAALRDHTRP